MIRKKIFIPNIVSNVMSEVISEQYAAGMEASLQRISWLLSEGDVVIIPKHFPKKFLEYVSSVRGVDMSKVCFLTPSVNSSKFLLENILKDDALLNELEEIIKSNPDTMLYPFVLDNLVLQLSEKLNTKIHPYRQDITVRELENIIKQIYYLNTKSGFREVCKNLNLPIAEGIFTQNKSDLINYAINQCEKYDLFVKRDRGSNGYQNFIIPKLSTIEDINKIVQNIEDIPHVVEKCITVEWAPSYEYKITEAGVEFLYDCDQRCINNSWSGMTIPPFTLSNELRVAMREAADVFANHAFKIGYRGILDVDGIISNSGEWYLSETNFRTTGGTHMHLIFEKYLGEGYLNNFKIIADNLYKGQNTQDFYELIDQIKEKDLLFDQKKKQGVIFTNSGNFDGKIRYLIISTDKDNTIKIEEKLNSIFSNRKGVFQ